MARVKTAKAEVVHGHAPKFCSCEDCKRIRAGQEPNVVRLRATGHGVAEPVKLPLDIGGPFPTIGFPTLTFTAKGMKGRYGYVSISEFRSELRWIAIK